jgi:hypothetical protein
MALQRNDPLPKKTQPPIVVWVYFETDVDDVNVAAYFLLLNPRNLNLNFVLC